ncbi:MAG: hypothetical protein EXR79_16925 [Myxococcales bacterium]|nr:hypothetical protein [Myxococcales bacterium]
MLGDGGLHGLQSNRPDGKGDRLIGGMTLSGGALAGLGAMALAQTTDMSSWQVTICSSGAVWGAWLAGWSLVPVPPEDPMEGVTRLLVGTDVGLALTALLVSPGFDSDRSVVAGANFGGHQAFLRNFAVIAALLSACARPAVVETAASDVAPADVTPAADVTTPADVEPDGPAPPDTAADVAESPQDSGPASWRSVLLPLTWSPTDDTDAEGRFLADFSYAGYHNGESVLPVITGPVFGVQADSIGASDSTAKFQAALDLCAKSGGGVVHVPAGLYRLDGTLSVTHSGVVLRGDGPAASRLWFTKAKGMSNQAHITFSGSVKDGPDLPLVQDATNRSFDVRLGDATSLSTGQTVALGWVISPEFVAEHGMTGVWQAFNGKWQPFFRRRVVSIDLSTKPHRVTLDVPLRYTALLRDKASLRVQTGYVSEVGIENLGLANAVTWTDAWAQTQAHVLTMRGVSDAWVRDVATFVSPGGPKSGPGVGAHVQSSGLMIEASARVTIAGSHVGRSENRGGGGNGYLFEIRTSSEVLMRDCSGSDGRHNFIQNWGFGTTGWVLLRCKSQGGTNVIVADEELGVMARSEFHHSLAMANLIDDCTFDDGFGAGNRGTESTGAGHTATQTVLWRSQGKGNVLSMQFGFGYVIGTAPGLSVTTTLDGWNAAGTAPEDFREGIGMGETLLPVSLYEAQLARRLQGGK